MGCIMSKDYMDNLGLTSNIADRIQLPSLALSDSIKSIMDSYKEAINRISYQDVLSDSLKSLSDSFRDISKAIDFDSISALTNLQSLAQSVSDAASSLRSLYLQNSLDVLKGIDFSGLSSMGDMSQLFGPIPDDITVDTVSELIKNGEITDEDFRSELKSTITGTENKAVKDKPSLIKKALKFVAIQLIVFLMAALISPVTDKVKEEIIETLRVNEFWQSTGIIDWIDSWSNDNHTATEDEAKATVDESKTGNISKQKREDLLSKVKEIRSFISNAPQDENTGNLLSYLSEIEKDINGKKYGLVFEEHREDIDEVLETHTPVLTEETDLFIDNGGQMNFLIEGDNLASLKLLEKTHKGKIQFIYIDPPYNTGNKDFSYDDRFVDSLDGFKHSKWLSFIRARLNIAKRLLTKQGVIFISIDENEMATLKVLCDSIFGIDNYIASIVVKSNPRGSQSTKQIANLHEYVLVYARDIVSAAIIGHELTDDMQSEYNLTDKNGKYRLLGLRQRGGFWRATERPKLFYPIYVDPRESSISLTQDDVHTEEVYPIQPTTGEKGTWRWSREKVAVEGDLLIGKQVSRNKQKVWDIYQKDYLSSGEMVRRTKAKSLWDEKEMNYQNAANELKALFGVSPFTYAKPTFLIQRALEMVDLTENNTVLDFFAGSGTTGHAVMKLNAKDGGNRRFILCTNNENNICRDVTYERISRVIDKEKYAASLKYYKVDYLPISERMYYEYADELLKHIRELVELENGINFTGNAEIAIVLTDDELDNFTQNIERYSACRKLYMGHDLLPDEDQERIIEENNIEINIIPDYYYRDLQEA